ncbi:hypothetical protein [Limnoglobus roseus]|uniref:Uncharacterized protein n=1 Tax=Limnoglobus roseus TaxID=2598579 RepID=A0A5C1AM32_9BACT|nr:hypothetical protein [Limnoglobus roseus]QEL18234.1 hypothetical protein PX52LOC_05250 [Limnoglobus roseus]
MTTLSNDPGELERHFRRRAPNLRFVSERMLNRVLAAMVKAGVRVPLTAYAPVWVDRDAARGFGVPSELITDADSSLLLVTPPDDRLLHDLDDATVLTVYDRLLNRAEVLRVLGDPAAWPDAELTRRFHTLSEPIRREIRFVLQAERLLPPEPTDAEVCRAFLPLFWELAKNRRTALADYFPLLAAAGPIDESILAGLPQAAVSTAPLPALPTREEVVTPDVDVRAILDHSRNVVRTAIQYYRRPEDRAVGVAILRDGLGNLLADALHWDRERSEHWKAILTAILPHTQGGRWTPAAKALYELQALALDRRDHLSAVAPFEWLRSWGRRSLRQSLDKARDVILLRHLAKAKKQTERVELSQAVRDELHERLEEERHAAESRIRETLGPVVRAALTRAGLVPDNRVDGIARDKLVGELLDGVCSRGFFRLSDLRDALARNDLKLPDLSGPGELWKGDALLRADKLLGEDLFGIYQRGEVYLRGIQRLSATAFGTPAGRAVTLYLFVPFLGAYLGLEFLQHILHAVLRVAALIDPPPEPHPHHHGPHLVTWWSMLLVGGALLLLVNSPATREIASRVLRAVGTILSATFIVLPQRIWALPPVQAVVRSWVVTVLWQNLALPLLIGGGVFGVAVLYDLSIPRAVFVGGLAFVGSVALLVTPTGRQIYERLAEGVLDTGRYVWASLIPGIVSWIVWLFREIAAAVERLLYTVDEWLRFRDGQSKESLVLKTVLAVVWFPIAYVVRFVFYLLVEPQVNPVKHFPVVTVSHKVIWPMVPQLSGLLGISDWYVAMMVNGVPGIFGFIAWELKENWRLYASNRPENLQPVAVGHHGETVRRLFRPGFHSGTVPKLYRKLRLLHDSATDLPAKVEKVHDELHHLAESLSHLVERELFPLLNEPHLSLGRVTLGCQRVGVELANGTADPLVLAWELEGDAVFADVVRRGWLASIDDARTKTVLMAVAGLNAKAAVPNPVRWEDWVKFWGTTPTATPPIPTPTPPETSPSAEALPKPSPERTG